MAREIVDALGDSARAAAEAVIHAAPTSVNAVTREKRKCHHRGTCGPCLTRNERRLGEWPCARRPEDTQFVPRILTCGVRLGVSSTLKSPYRSAGFRGIRRP